MTNATVASVRLQIVKDAGKLNQLVNTTMKNYASVGKALHVALVSAIHHTMASGNTDVLTRIHNGLRTNDQAALRNYLRRIHIAAGIGTPVFETGLDAEVYQAAAAKGAVLNFSKKDGNRFKIINGRMEQRKFITNLCESHLIKPEVDENGVGWTMFLDRNLFAEQKQFGDADLVKALRQIQKKATGEKDNITSTVSDKARDRMEVFISDMETLADQDLETQDSGPVVPPAAANDNSKVESAEVALH